MLPSLILCICTLSSCLPLEPMPCSLPITHARTNTQSSMMKCWGHVCGQLPLRTSDSLSGILSSRERSGEVEWWSLLILDCEIALSAAIVNLNQSASMFLQSNCKIYTVKNLNPRGCWLGSNYLLGKYFLNESSFFNTKLIKVVI